MMQVEGYVQKITSKPTSTGKTMYNVMVNGVSYGAGLYAPKFKDGDFISFQATKNGNWDNMETRSVTVKQPPAGHASIVVAQTGGSTGNSFDARQDAITHQASRNSALTMVGLLKDVGGIPGLTKAKNEADKMQLLVSLVNEFTKDYYEYVTGKKLELIDTGLDAPAKAASLPDSWDE